jgi:hypothetical protein
MIHQRAHIERSARLMGVALDPDYALAPVMLAESQLWSAFWGSTDPREAFARAKSAALEALRLDDSIADAHSALGTVLGSGEFDWNGAEREFRRWRNSSTPLIWTRRSCFSICCSPSS